MTGLWRRITSWFTLPRSLAALAAVLLVGAGIGVWSAVGTSGGPRHTGTHSASGPSTAAGGQGSSTSSPSSTAPTPEYAAASGSSPSSSVPSTTTLAPTTSAPPPTTEPPPPACQTSVFTPSVSTDQTSYSTGELVRITTTVTNTGPACTETEQAGFTCPGANVDNSSGQLVWTSAPAPDTGCASKSGPPTVLPSGWAQQTQFVWAQDVCTNRVNACPQNQVPPGQYSVFGTNWNLVSSPVTVTITSTGPGSPTSAP